MTTRNSTKDVISKALKDAKSFKLRQPGMVGAGPDAVGIDYRYTESYQPIGDMMRHQIDSVSFFDRKTDYDRYMIVTIHGDVTDAVAVWFGDDKDVGQSMFDRIVVRRKHDTIHR